MSMEKMLQTMGNDKEKATSVYSGESFEKPFSVEFGPGKILLAASEIGESSLRRNEDRVIICPETKSFAVIDGMGGYGNGDIMAEVLKEELLKEMSGAITERGMAQCHFRTQTKMKNALTAADQHSNGGAVYTLCKYSQRELIIAHAGDASICIFDKNGNEIKNIKDTDLINAPGVYNSGRTTIDFAPCPGNTSVLLGSDGFWDNIGRETAIEIVLNNSTRNAFQELHEIVKANMQKPDGKKDNVSLILFSL